MKRFPAITFLGVMLLVPAQAAFASTITNGDFETGDTTGWTLGPNCSFFSAVDGTSQNPNSSGAFGFASGEIGTSCTISQTVATASGQQYEFSFWLSNDSGVDPANGSESLFEVTFGGTSLMQLANSDAFAYGLASFFVTPSNATTEIVFSFRQDFTFWHLDDVALDRVDAAAAVPEPSSMLLLSAGLLCVSRFRKKRAV